MGAIVLQQQLETLPESDETEKKLMKIVLIGNASTKILEANCQQPHRHFLMEFCSGYISEKMKKPVAPSTMLRYVRSFQRRLFDLGYRVNLFRGPIFDCPRYGLKAVMDSKFAQQQCKGGTTKTHNVLTLEDVKVFSIRSFPRNLMRKDPRPPLFSPYTLHSERDQRSSVILRNLNSS